ncbi:Glycerol uptake operon antiterminator regulatory protein OS=Ureibacillus acetophenoni OX=614649 GN=SAMN05877842_104175 PE=4 SV=1 [Ureibacillus acetophenoni]
MNKRLTKSEVIKNIQSKKKIAAIKNMKDFDLVLKNHQELAAAFLLTGNISNISRFIEAIQSKGLPVFIHIEKIGGLALNSEGLEFIANVVKPEGVISTKPGLLKKAHSLGLICIQRVFMIDSEVFENTIAHKEVQPDIIEIMPSIAYEIITALKEKIDVPIITGGLIRTVEDVKKALNAGAIGISTSNNHVWRSFVN